MQLIIDTEKFTGTDLVLLKALIAEHSDAPAKAAAPAAKKAAAPKAKPEPEPEAEDEDLLGGDAPTKKDALAAASKLVADGKSATVKAAIEAVGIKRVSEISDEQVPAFLEALEG